MIVSESSVALGPYSSLGKSLLTGDLNAGSVTSELPPSVSFLTAAALSGERDIEVYNGVSVTQDGNNVLMKIRTLNYILKNNVRVFHNRWGDRFRYE
ncbi:MAG: hypothetical protein IPK96_06510 [Flammeovirgaceae bacterium]|nr:hypothetical protein [Flammeovirgaceae bacterium]